MTCPDTPMAQAAAPTPIRIERRWPKEGHTRIPNWVYTDPDVFRKEMDVFFGGKTWNYVGLDCEVPEPGCYKRNWIGDRSEEHTSELQSLMRSSYAVFCLKKKK